MRDPIPPSHSRTCSRKASERERREGMASMKRREEEGGGQNTGPRESSLFQRQAGLSTIRLGWKGKDDSRVPLYVVEDESEVSLSRYNGAAVFVNFTPSLLLSEEWLVVRVWQGILKTQEEKHSPGCSCCINAFGIGSLLMKIFRERATGKCDFFTHITLFCKKDARSQVLADLEADRFIFGLYGLKSAH